MGANRQFALRKFSYILFTAAHEGNAINRVSRLTDMRSAKEGCPPSAKSGRYTKNALHTCDRGRARILRCLGTEHRTGPKSPIGIDTMESWFDCWL
jgi:hypothetical protein